MPCHPARAKELLKKRKAEVYRLFPFTIILKQRAEEDVQLIECKVDPGSKTTGTALVGEFSAKFLGQSRGGRSNNHTRFATYGRSQKIKFTHGVSQ